VGWRWDQDGVVVRWGRVWRGVEMGGRLAGGGGEVSARRGGGGVDSGQWTIDSFGTGELLEGPDCGGVARGRSRNQGRGCWEE